ncbi:MAG: MnmC family methyltransferase [Muribaculaceae bacterium]|nr:MnmC family methyltransferase [Muribaculaceae bacterium]
MYDFHPYFTADGSVGLFSPEYNDIYHSATGALTEAMQKFVSPIDINALAQKKSVKVLDICYGIGYNSKSFLNKILSLTETSIGSIYTNNHHKDRATLSPCNDKVYSDNIFSKISVTAVDNDKILTFLSPFIKTGEKNIKNKNFDFEYKTIEKYLENDNNIQKPEINKLINFSILKNLLENQPDFIVNPHLEAILTSSKYKRYIDSDLKGLYYFYKYKSGKVNHVGGLLSFLHNIYYRNISKRMEKRLKALNLHNLDFNLKIGDARDIIKHDDTTYDFIFLDAFTPSKCPCLWSYEFFNLLFKHLNNDGIILTYSSSAAIRAAMIEAGFVIGENFNPKENKTMGTIAAKNKSHIKYPLSEFDLGLLKTSAGIFYRDKNLTGQNEAIIERRKSDVKNSTRISSSKYKKLHNHG